MSAALGVFTRRLISPVLAAVFPSPCAACGVFLDAPLSGPLCPECWSALPRHRSALCECGTPLWSSTPRCGRCRRGLSPFTHAASLGQYDGTLRVLLHELKYHGRQRVAVQLASALLQEPRVRNLLSSSAVLVPVPLHPRRLRERGYNQSELLARAVAERAGVRVCVDALVRRKDTVPQTGLTAAQRRANVGGAFRIHRRASVTGQEVVIVDDIFTTGATLRACAEALRKGGARDVRVLTVARVS